MHCCRDSTPGERETAPSVSPIHLRPVWLRPVAVKNKWHGSWYVVDLAVAAAIQDLPLQIFVFEKCTFTTLSNVFAPANVPFAAAALLSQLRDCTCKISFQATKVPPFLQRQIFAAAAKELTLRLSHHSSLCGCKTWSKFAASMAKNSSTLQKCLLFIQLQKSGCRCKVYAGASNANVRFAARKLVAANLNL